MSKPLNVFLRIILFIFALGFALLLIVNGLIGAGESSFGGVSNSTLERSVAVLAIAAGVTTLVTSCYLFRVNNKKPFIIMIISIIVAWTAFMLGRGFEPGLDFTAFFFISLMIFLYKVTGKNF